MSGFNSMFNSLNDQEKLELFSRMSLFFSEKMGERFNQDSMSDSEKIDFLADMFTQFSQKGSQPSFGFSHFGGTVNTAQNKYSAYQFTPWQFFREMSGFYPWEIMSQMFGDGPNFRGSWGNEPGFCGPPWRRW